MQLSVIDNAIIIGFFGISLLIGLWAARKAGTSSSEFFLSGRNMPWWLLGVSMVATTFSADTPNFVTQVVRQNGVSGNWVWWAFLLTGMLTVFVYAKLWRRSGMNTDLEFYELRYGGKPAAILRGFRALYLGVFFNVMIMAGVCLAAIKIGAVMLGLSPITTLAIAGSVTVVYSMFGGLRGVLITDLFQFALSMLGTIWAASVALNMPEVGGLQNLLAQPQVTSLTNMFPDFSEPEQFIPLLIIPLAVQWWSVWYPGAEPGGGGYIAQRMLAAKNEKHAMGATLLFNVAHYALRPWPWIIIALCSVLVFPDLSSLQEAFPHVEAEILNDDLAYPAMMTLLPAGLLGLVLASLIAAFMSTISTHLNWGSSYVVNDFYRRFLKPEANERELVWVGRLSTFLLMGLAALFALALENAIQAFNILLQIGAGTGGIFILRWFWPRINAWTEIAGMVISFLVAIVLELVCPDACGSLGHWKLVMGVGITTVGWLAVTLLTPKEDESVLRSFAQKVRPGAGWAKYLDGARGVGVLPMQILGMFLGCVGVYGVLFGFGALLYDNSTWGAGLLLMAAASFISIFAMWKRL